MIEQDTVRLLRECDAGIKMGVSSIEDVLNYVQAGPFKRCLTDCKAEHEKLENEIKSFWTNITTREKIPASWQKACQR